MKMNISNDNILIILILIIGIIIITCFNRNKKKEGFGELEDHTKNLEMELKKKLPDLTREQLFEIIVNLKQNNNINPSDFITTEQHGKITEMTEKQARKLLEEELTTNDKKIITLESQVDSLTKVITKKNEQLVKIEQNVEDLIKNPKVDYNKYVLKESIPPVRQCPPCVCPKVSVSAGLCKKCPPPPKCPEPERCPEVKCPDQVPCENELSCPIPQACPPPPTCPEPKPCKKPLTKFKDRIKYIKVPTFISNNSNLLNNDENKIVNRNTYRNTYRNNSRNNSISNSRNHNASNIAKISKNIPSPEEDKSSLMNNNYKKADRDTNNNQSINNMNYNVRELNSEYVKAAYPIIGRERFINF